MQDKIAVLGDIDFVMPFSALGLDTYAVGKSEQQIIENAEKIIREGYTLIVISEDVATATQEIFSSCRNKPVPCILVVPFTAESTGFATQELGKALKMATGINILHNE